MEDTQDAVITTLRGFQTSEEIHKEKETCRDCVPGEEFDVVAQKWRLFRDSRGGVLFRVRMS